MLGIFQSMAYMLCGNMDKGVPEYQLEAAIRYYITLTD